MVDVACSSRRSNGSFCKYYYIGRRLKKRLDLATEFLLWAGSKTSRQREYNCSLCKAGPNFEQRNCFWFGSKVQEIEAVQDVNSEDVILYKKGDKVKFDSEEFINSLGEIIDIYPEMSPLDVIRAIFPKVCPKSLSNSGIGDLISMEAFCRDYHVPPLGAEIGFLDYNTLMIEVFGVISVARERVKAREIEEMRTK